MALVLRLKNEWSVGRRSGQAFGGWVGGRTRSEQERGLKKKTVSSIIIASSWEWLVPEVPHEGGGHMEFDASGIILINEPWAVGTTSVMH